MNKILAQTLVGLAGLIRGGVGSAFSYLNTLIKSGFDSTMKFHQEGIAFAREMGMSAKEAQAYTEVLTERTEKLAMKYGVAAEQVKELQRNISIATSRQLMLNESQAEQFLQLNKLVGSSTTTKFTEELVGMGGQLDTVTGAVSKAYVTAAKSGLSAQKVSEKIANNLNMANKLSFRTGIDGLTRMAMQAEKVGLSLQSVEGVANNFMEIDSAIEHAAKLNMLGGNAAIMGSNPLDMAYEANYDPEALQDRMIKSLAGYAQFDPTKGIASVNGINMDFVRNIAKALGMDESEAVKVAKKNAEVKFKESNINFGAYGNLTQEQIDFLINKSNVANGRTTFTTSDGEIIDLSKGQEINSKVLEEMMKYEGMSDHEIMAQNAQSLSSIQEILNGIKDSIRAMFAKFLEGMFPKLQGDLKNFGAFAKEKLEPIAKNIGVAARGVYDWLKEHKEPIRTVLSGIATFLKFATEHWKLLIGFFAGKKLIDILTSVGIGKGLGGKMASGSANAISNVFGRMHKGSAHQLFKQRYANHASRGVTFGQAAKSTWRATSKMAKGTAALGALTGIIQGVGAVSEYNRKKEEINNSNMSEAEKAKALDEARIDKNSEIGGAVGAGVGTVLGTFFFGPLGGMIGGAVGEFAGKFIGQYWDPIANTFVNMFKALGKGISWLAEKSWNGIKWLIDNNPIGLMVKGIGKIFGKDWSVTGIIDSIFGTEKHAEGGVVGGNSYSGDKVLAGLNSGEAVVTPKQFHTLLDMAETIVKSKPTVGGTPQYIYIPRGSETSRINGNAITVKDFNININGTLKLDGGNSSRNLDIKELLNDRAFVNALKDVVKNAINQDINGGRHMNDLAVMGGYPAQSSVYGK